MDLKTALRSGLVVASAALAATALTPSAHAQDVTKVYVSAGFDGNTWMDASLNLLRAISQTKDYKDTVELDIQSARGDAQTQQQQINAMVQAGADVIVAWPISPTALNRAVRSACQQGVTFITWDAAVTEPCAYHVGINQDWAGAGPAEWLAERLDGAGDIIFMGGIPGTLVDTRRNEAAKAVFAQHPDINIIAETPSMWNPATARQKMSEIIAAQGWDSIDGVWTQTGCYEFSKLQVEAGRTEFIPCAGNGSNGFRVAMLPEGETEGALGVPGVSMGSPPWAAPHAFELGLQANAGEEIEKFTEVPMPLVTTEDVRMCQTADREELVENNWECSAVPLDIAPANFFIDVWSERVPELDLYSALEGTVPEGQ